MPFLLKCLGSAKVRTTKVSSLGREGKDGTEGRERGSFKAHAMERSRAARAYNILGCVASWARIDSVLVKLERCSKTTKDVRGRCL